MAVSERPGFVGECQDRGDMGDDQDCRRRMEGPEAEEEVADAFLIHVVGGFVEDEQG
jgi:hypothetical protein